MRGRNHHSRIGLVAVAGSAGGSVAMCEILARLPADFPSPILYVQHLNTCCRSELAELLQSHTVLEVRWARQGDLLAAGVVYVSPSGSSLAVNLDGSLTLVPMATLCERLHAADCFFTSIAATYGSRALAIILSGAGWDGTEGLCALHEAGGAVFAQDEDSAFLWGMPKAAIAAGCVDSVLPLREIAPVLVNLVRDGHPLATVLANAAALVRRDGMFLAPRLRDSLGKFLAMALSIRRTDLGNIQLFNPETGALSIVTQRGFGLNFLEYFGVVGKQDASACGRAMRSREPVVIADVTTDPGFAVHRGIAASAGFRAVQSTPLISPDGAFLGVMSTHFRGPHSLSALELRTFELHARRTASMIEQINGG
jgi:two-component system chemotaxis response regulator CheB